MAGQRVTSKDVARLAGVSRSAVSLVLNGHGAGNISEVNQRAILEAARTLKYQPSSVALSLRHQRTMTVGVVTDFIVSSAFGGHLLRGATRAALGAHYVLLTIDTDDEPQREVLAFEHLRQREVDGFMYVAQGMHVRPVPAPMRDGLGVMVNCFDPDRLLPSVCADELAGGRAAAELAIRAGHRDIVLIAGTFDVLAATLRTQGYVSAMEAAGLTPLPPVEGGWTLDVGYRAAVTVLDRPDRPTAILAGNDRAAVGLALAAAHLGLRIPQDLSLVGYDDDENQAPVMVPPLTTVRLPHEEIGAAGFEMLLAALTGRAGDVPEQRLVPCPVVERDSVGPPAR